MGENSLVCKTSIFWFSFSFCQARDEGEGTAPWETAPHHVRKSSLATSTHCPKEPKSSSTAVLPHTSENIREETDNVAGDWEPYQGGVHALQLPHLLVSHKSQDLLTANGSASRNPHVMSTALTRPLRRPHGLCGDFSWAPPTSCPVRKGEKQLPCRNVYWDQM